MAMTHSFREVGAERVIYPKIGARPDRLVAARAIHQDVHPGVYIAFVSCWAALFAVFLATFAESPFTIFMVTIGALTGVALFGVPYILSRVAPPSIGVAKVSFLQFLRDEVETCYGRVSGTEALIQVIMVPLALTLGALAISTIIHLEADHIHMLYVGRTGAFPQ